MTEQKIDSQKYIEFVKQTTSPASTNFEDLISRMRNLNDSNANVPRLITAAFGLGAEAGEFTEIVKKVFLQGKPYNQDNITHLRSELGDLLWYFAQACIALDCTFDDLLQINYKKLSARYPEGTFDVWRSENRKEGDI